MKSTGIIRRLDDLGRVVIPKELRRALNVREGDPLELCPREDGILVRKYSPLGTMQPYFTAPCVASLQKALPSASGIIITDCDEILSYTTRMPHSSLSKEYSDFLRNERPRLYITPPKFAPISIDDGCSNQYTQIIHSILSWGELYGSIIVRYPAGIMIPAEDERAIELAANLLALSLED